MALGVSPLRLTCYNDGMDTLYYRDSHARAADTEILKTGSDERGFYAVARDTCFYPEGGGEPGDRGTLNGVRVLDTQKAGGEIRHYLERAVAAGPCRMELDWPRRRRFMQHHTAQHILTALAEKVFNWKTISFHLGENYAVIDLEGSDFTPERLAALEEAADAVVREGRPVTAEFMSRERYATEQVRSRLLPEDLEGDIRVVAIEGVDRNTCGGMHVSDAREIQMIRLLPPEKIKEGVRLPYLAGTGIADYLRRTISLQKELKEILGCGPEDVAATARAWAAERQSSRRNQRRFQEAIPDMLGKGLEERSFHYFPGTDTAFLTRLAPLLSSRWPERTLILCGEDGQNLFFVILQGEKSVKAAEEIFRKVLKVTGGKGGGKGAQFQGKASAGPVLERLLARAGEFD